MKTFLSILFLAASVLYTACSNNSNSKENTSKNTDTSSQVSNTNSSNEQKSTPTINDVVSGYLRLKDALTNDNGDDAASAAKEMGEALVKVNESALAADQKKIYGDVKDDIKEHAEHIGANGSNIEHQREHFDMLSQDMIALVKASGTSKTLYKDFCPMYNNKKGASWLSDTKEINNPYYGKQMPKCGEVKEEIKPKG
jgi:hypothetical protein